MAMHNSRKENKDIAVNSYATIEEEEWKEEQFGKFRLGTGCESHPVPYLMKKWRKNILINGTDR